MPDLVVIGARGIPNVQGGAEEHAEKDSTLMQLRAC